MRIKIKSKGLKPKKKKIPSWALPMLLCASVVLWAREALAIDVIKDKVEAISTAFSAIAAVIVGIGAIWCGLKFIKGDQDSWVYTWKFLLGATIVFTSGQIVTWLQT